MTNWKARCAELLNGIELDVAHEGIENPDRFQALINRTRAALAQPEPEGLKDDDVEAAARMIYGSMRFERLCDTPAWVERGNSLAQDEARECARAVLARWGRPAIKPVPVAESLPGLEDCDTRGRCWFIDDDEKWWPVIIGDILDEDEPDAIQRIIDCYGYTHWLQGWALPVPR